MSPAEAFDVGSTTNRFHYLTTAIGLAAATSAYAVGRYLNGGLPSDDFFHLYNIVSAILVVSWVLADPAIPAAQRPTFDHGMLMWMSFPFLAAYQMYVAHRWRGVLAVLGMLCIISAPSIALAIVRRIA